LDPVDVEELVNQLWEEKERDRELDNERDMEEDKTIGLEKRRNMARYGKISSWKPSQ
jgi:hypothetical protein